MTTIVFDGKYLAADSQRNNSGYAVATACKIHRIKNGWLAGAGEPSAVKSVVNWLNGDSEKPTDINDGDFGALVVYDNGDCEELDERLVPYKQEIPYAIGSGCFAALVALKCGKNALESIEITSQVDHYTGMPVRYVEVAGLGVETYE